VTPRIGWGVGLAGRVEDRDRMVLVVGVCIRLAAVGTLALGVPLLWAHFPHPTWSALVAAGLAIETGAVIAWWLWRRAIGPTILALEVPVGVLALLFGRFLDAPAGVPGWTDFPYPYTVMVSITVGLCCTGPGLALLTGLTWGVACAGGAIAIDHTPWAGGLALIPAYLANAVVGWLAGRTLRRTADEVGDLRTRAVGEAIELATVQERARQARELHDRVLQTVETLARDGTALDEQQRQRLTTQAAWLRHLVETGMADQPADLAAELDSIIRIAAPAGVRVDLNDAGLRARSGTCGLGAPQREALLECVLRTILSLVPRTGTVTLRAGMAGPDVLVTVLAPGSFGPAAPDEVASLSGQLGAVGGRVVAESTGYLRLYVPTGGDETAIA
jgi:hypothetical protein